MTETVTTALILSCRGAHTLKIWLNMRPKDFLSAQELTEQEKSLLSWTDNLKPNLDRMFRQYVSKMKENMKALQQRNQRRELEFILFLNSVKRVQPDPFHSLKLAELSKQLALHCFDYVQSIQGNELLNFILFKDSKIRQEKCPNLMKAMEQFQKVCNRFLGC